MKKSLATLFLSILASVSAAAQTSIFNCSSGFNTTVGNACEANIASTDASTAFLRRNASGAVLDGTKVILIDAFTNTTNGTGGGNDSSSNHNGYALNYKTPVNVQAFTSKFSWIPNGQNIVFLLQNSNVNTGYTGNAFSSGAGCEGGFYQAYGTMPDNVFGLVFEGNSPENSTFSYSSVQIYQSNQSPCVNNDGGPGYWPTTKLSTSPVPLNSPAGTGQTTTGHIYTATIGYDGSNLNLCFYDTTTSGASCSANGTTATGTAYQHTWTNLRIASIVDAQAPNYAAYVGLVAGLNLPNLPNLEVVNWSYTVNSPAVTTATMGTGAPLPVAGVTTSNAQNPTLSVPAGSYASAQSVVLTDSTDPGAYFCVSLGPAGLVLTPQPDNIGGCTVGTLNTGAAIPITSSETLYAVTGIANPTPGADYTTNSSGTKVYTHVNQTGKYSTNLPSGLVQAAYTIGSGTAQAAAPTASPASGTYSSAQSVTLSGAAGTLTCYNFIGSPATNGGSGCASGSTLYTTSIPIATSKTIFAVSGGSGYTDSPVATFAYTITTPAGTPTFSPAPGSYTTPQSVSIADVTAGVTIYYTTNGTTPTTSSTVYSGPISVAATETIQAIAAGAGLTTSPTASATYTIQTQAATPTIALASGSYAMPTSTTITDYAGTNLFYCLSTATCSPATAYTTAVAISGTSTLCANGTATGYSTSATVCKSYIAIAVPQTATPSITLAAGSFVMPKNTTITDATTGAVISYCTGAAACTPGTTYASAVTINAVSPLYLCANAIATGYSVSATSCRIYTAATPASGGVTPTQLGAATSAQIQNAIGPNVYDPFGAAALIQAAVGTGMPTVDLSSAVGTTLQNQVLTQIAAGFASEQAATVVAFANPGSAPTDSVYARVFPNGYSPFSIGLDFVDFATMLPTDLTGAAVSLGVADNNGNSQSIRFRAQNKSDRTLGGLLYATEQGNTSVLNFDPFVFGYSGPYSNSTTPDYTACMFLNGRGGTCHFLDNSTLSLVGGPGRSVAFQPNVSGPNDTATTAMFDTAGAFCVGALAVYQTCATASAAGATVFQTLANGNTFFSGALSGNSTASLVFNFGNGIAAQNQYGAFDNGRAYVGFDNTMAAAVLAGGNSKLAGIAVNDTGTFPGTYAFVCDVSGNCGVGPNAPTSDSLYFDNAGHVKAGIWQGTAIAKTYIAGQAGSGAGLTTGPVSGTTIGDIATFSTTTGQIQDGGPAFTAPLAFAACSGTATASTTLALFGLGTMTGGCTGAPDSGLGMVTPKAGTLSNLTVRCKTTGVNSSSGVFTLYDQPSAGTQVATTLTVTYGTTTATTSVYDNTHTYAYAKGDMISIKFTTQASETLGECSASFNY